MFAWSSATCCTLCVACTAGHVLYASLQYVVFMACAVARGSWSKLYSDDICDNWLWLNSRARVGYPVQYMKVTNMHGICKVGRHHFGVSTRYINKVDPEAANHIQSSCIAHSSPVIPDPISCKNMHHPEVAPPHAYRIWQMQNNFNP
jgi:hypothetical protein